MTIFSSFSVNFTPCYHTILAINCVHASNWFTHLEQTQQIYGQNDNSVLTVLIYIYMYIGKTERLFGLKTGIGMISSFKNFWGKGGGMSPAPPIAVV